MKDVEIFEGKSFSTLLRDIHDSTVNRRAVVENLIYDLRTAIKADNVEMLVVIAPIIKDYLELLTRSDEHNVKLAAIVQKLVLAEKGDVNLENLLSDEEKMQLVESAQHTLRELESPKVVKMEIKP
jgi:hypothetical protein